MGLRAAAAAAASATARGDQHRASDLRQHNCSDNALADVQYTPLLPASLETALVGCIQSKLMFSASLAKCRSCCCVGDTGYA